MLINLVLFCSQDFQMRVRVGQNLGKLSLKQNMHKPSSILWKKNQYWLYANTCYLALSQLANQPYVSAQLAKHVSLRMH